MLKISAAYVLEIMPKEFRLLTGYKQSEIIDKVFASILKSVSGKTSASLVKIDRPVLLDSYIEQEKKKKPDIANAQMLLVMKWLDNEIIKNKEFNAKYGTKRKIIVVIDEAHVFIDTKYPIALDFMFQLAKRIRKYNGMQIVITQNIKDFVGSPEIARKSTAIINACQYSMIFALSPNDMDDLCTLYEKAGGINETEQQDIVNNNRGSAFMITGPLSGANASIVASEYVKSLFGEGNKE